ncbi:MAG: hypothetical protein ABW146_04445 [Candidatus Sedimenticola sp. 6PFRAG7]
MSPKKKVAKKKVTSRKTSTSKSPVRKKTAARRGRPPKAASSPSAATAKKRVTRKKVSKKKTAPASTQSAAVSRRGRPVSVDVLQRKLTVAQDALAKEKARRIDARAKLSAALAEKKQLKSKLKEVATVLDRLDKEQKAAEKSAAQQLKMETARNDAIAKFLAKWEKNYLAAQTKKTGGRGKRRRGRPRKS